MHHEGPITKFNNEFLIFFLLALFLLFLRFFILFFYLKFFFYILSLSDCFSLIYLIFFTHSFFLSFVLPGILRSRHFVFHYIILCCLCSLQSSPVIHPPSLSLALILLLIPVSLVSLAPHSRSTTSDVGFHIFMD